MTLVNYRRVYRSIWSSVNSTKLTIHSTNFPYSNSNIANFVIRLKSLRSLAEIIWRMPKSDVISSTNTTRWHLWCYVAVVRTSLFRFLFAFQHDTDWANCVYNQSVNSLSFTSYLFKLDFYAYARKESKNSGMSSSNTSGKKFSFGCLINFTCHSIG